MLSVNGSLGEHVGFLKSCTDPSSVLEELIKARQLARKPSWSVKETPVLLRGSEVWWEGPGLCRSDECAF